MTLKNSEVSHGVFVSTFLFSQLQVVVFVSIVGVSISIVSIVSNVSSVSVCIVNK